MAFIEINDLTYSYGTKIVLERISLSVEKGEVIGILGPSGAGKTTLVNIMTGQLRADPQSLHYEKPNLVSGIMMDSMGLYERLSVWDNLKLFADIYQVGYGKIDSLLERAGLSAAKKTAVIKLSKGMRSRVNFCRAMLREMDILYLDEPTSGLDPTTTDKIHTLIEEEKAKGATIFLTTHNMHEADKLCDRIFLLHTGKIIEQGAPEAICRKYNQENKINVALKDGTTAAFVNGKEGAKELERLMSDGQIVSIHSSEPSLETVFLHLTGRKLNE